MVFIYREVTVSGGNEGVEGTSGCVNAIADILVDAGWSIVDDRRDQSGSTALANTHKVVLESNGGEAGNLPNWYMTVVSGNGTTIANNIMGIQVSTAYDVGTHLTPASGVDHPNTTSTSILRPIGVDSDGYNALFMAADKDGIVFVNNYHGTVFSVNASQRVDTFLSPELEPYGIMNTTWTNTSIVTSNATGIVGDNPPQDVSSNPDASTLAYGLSAANQPRQNLGQEEALWTATPVLWVINDSSPVRKGAVGYIRNMYYAATSTAGLPFIGRATVSGTAQEFRTFGGAQSIFMRTG